MQGRFAFFAMWLDLKKKYFDIFSLKIFSSLVINLSRDLSNNEEDPYPYQGGWGEEWKNMLPPPGLILESPCWRCLLIVLHFGTAMVCVLHWFTKIIIILRQIFIVEIETQLLLFVYFCFPMIYKAKMFTIKIEAMGAKVFLFDIGILIAVYIKVWSKKD